jgi:hypothetical protein
MTGRSAVTAGILFLLMFSTSGCTQKADPLGSFQAERSIRNILQLSTYEYIYRDIIFISEKDSFLFINTVDKQALFAVDVVVQAGVNLDGGIDLRSDLPAKSIQVELPPARILRIDAKEETIAQYFVREKGGSIPRLAYYDEIDRKKENLAADARRRGILIEAEEKTRQLIVNLLTLAGFETVRVRFVREEEPE